MARKVFYSFHYKPDNWRASQVRNMNLLEGNRVLSDNDWEEVTGGGDSAIKAWIDGQLAGKSCAVVLIGTGTAGRKWINYEIETAWNAGKGLVGIHIHNLKDVKQEQSGKGGNPFASFSVGDKALSSIIKTYDPPFSTSTYVYEHIQEHIEDWVEEAITIRGGY